MCPCLALLPKAFGGLPHSPTPSLPLLLAVCRLRGRDSELCPWLALLPKAFGSTLFFGDRELEWLKGTTLHKATL